MAHKYRVTGVLPLDIHGSGETYVKGQEFTAEFNEYEESCLIECGAIELVKGGAKASSESKEG